MRFTALLGCVAVVTACSTKDAPPAADTAAMAADSPTVAPSVSLASVAAIWNVTVKPEGKDSVATTYILNNTDTTGWLFAFPGQRPIKMRVTGTQGDTIMTSTDWFDSSVRPGLKARSDSKMWVEEGKLKMKTTVHYQTTGPDTVRVFDSEGIRN